jgi:hypothetical protein
MIINTKYNIGDEVILDYKVALKGRIVEITVSVNKDKIIDFVYKIKLETGAYIVDDGKRITKIGIAPKNLTLAQLLTTDVKGTEEILSNLARAIDSKKQLEEAEEKLKSMLDLNPGQSVKGDGITVSCSVRPVLDFTQNKEYTDAIEEVSRVKDFLKLSGKIKTKETIVISAKLSKE